MGDANHGKFIDLHTSGKLLPVEAPGTVIASLVLRATQDLSGRFLSWDDSVLKPFGRQ